MNQPQIMMPNMCTTHRQLLVGQTGFGPNDAWRALEIVTQIVLFQGASCDPKVHAETAGIIENISKLGCLACRKPDLFGQIVHAAQTSSKANAIGVIKALGDKWINEAKK